MCSRGRGARCPSSSSRCPAPRRAWLPWSSSWLPPRLSPSATRPGRLWKTRVSHHRPDVSRSLLLTRVPSHLSNLHSESSASVEHGRSISVGVHRGVPVVDLAQFLVSTYGPALGAPIHENIPLPLVREGVSRVCAPGTPLDIEIGTHHSWARVLTLSHCSQCWSNRDYPVFGSCFNQH